MASVELYLKLNFSSQLYISGSDYSGVSLALNVSACSGQGFDGI